MITISRKDGSVTGSFSKEERDFLWEAIIRAMAPNYINVEPNADAVSDMSFSEGKTAGSASV